MKRLLLIEPDPFLSMLFLKRLRRRAFDVRHATHAEEALRLIESELPEMILTSLILPRQNGFEFIEIIRVHPEARDVPIAVYSRLGSREDIERCRHLGVTSYFIKSHHTPDQVIAALERAWSEGGECASI